VLYTLWYLTSQYGKNERITALLDSYSFYLLPMVNPDGRQYWFDQPGTPNSSRHNRRAIDRDRDGSDWEDGPDDLDGDKHITQMWKTDPRGRWVRSQTDERVFVRLRDDQAAAAGVTTYTNLGEEGIDNDGDGRVNEDPPFGDDMNRNWPGDWQPDHVQGGAGPYPLSAPETRCVAEFMLDHPNIAAAQSYHNTGGMVIRGPGAGYRERMYPGEDVRVYDELARTGEQMLPYYRYLVLFSGLYRVHGGFVNWAAESLGAFSFTNELWTDAKYFQRDQTNPSDEQRWAWRDRMAFGALHTPLKEFDHPQFGKVLIGGLNKWSARVTPGFMLEEECHRNFAFTMYHADQMPVVEFGRVESSAVIEGAVWRLRVEIRNLKLMPTRSALRQRERIGQPDLIECVTNVAGAGGSEARIIAANRMNDWLDRTPVPIATLEPGRVLIDDGVPGRGARVVDFIIEGKAGDAITIRYTSAWAKTIERRVELDRNEVP